MPTLPQLIEPALALGQERALAERPAGGDWTYTSSAQLRARVTALAYALRGAGAKRGDRVAIVSNNCVDWIVADLAIVYAGCVSVPIFATAAADQLRFILEDCEAKLVFVQRQADLERVAAACPSPVPIVHFDGDAPGSLAAFERAGALAQAADPAAVEGWIAAVRPDDLAVLIYTSGTTGDPKGVMLSQNNIGSDSLLALTYAFAMLRPGDTVLSVLPFAHIYEHATVVAYLAAGVSIHVTVPERLLDDMRSARPIAGNLVPRIYERVLAGLVGKARAEGGLRAKLVPWALEAGREYMDAIAGGKAPSLGQRLQYRLAHELVLRKIRPALGLDRLVLFTSGSAALHRDLALTFAAADIPICQGYGLTETSPVITTNRLSDNRYGSVGRPLPGVEIRIAADGEIETRGPNVMQGYYHRPDEHPIDKDGWFATGDIGRIDSDGFLYITDRKKELIKTSGGKFISPARVETAIFVSQVMLVGDGRPHPAALVAINVELVRRELEIPDSVPAALVPGNPRVLEFIRAEIGVHTADLAAYEQVRRIALLPRELTIEDGELSPTLKVKRRVVEERYKSLIDTAYAEKLERGAGASKPAAKPGARPEARPGAQSGAGL
jgi:long-chain acyl-CoA synthetase